MTERRLPPALEGARFLVTPDKSRFIYEQDLLDFFRGTKETRTPGLVERVGLRVHTENRRELAGVIAAQEALRAELGEET